MKWLQWNKLLFVSPNLPCKKWHVVDTVCRMLYICSLVFLGLYLQFLYNSPDAFAYTLQCCSIGTGEIAWLSRWTIRNGWIFYVSNIPPTPVDNMLCLMASNRKHLSMTADLGDNPHKSQNCFPVIRYRISDLTFYFGTFVVIDL